MLARSRAASTSAPVLTGLTESLAGSYSVARQAVPGYSGSLIRVYNTTTTSQVDIPHVGGYLNETALLAARASGQKLVIHTFYDQSGAGNNLVAADITKALRIVDASGNIQRLGRLPCGITEADNTGLYVATLPGAHTGTMASGYFVGTYPRDPAIFGSFSYGVANGSGVTFNTPDAASFIVRSDKTLNGYVFRNSAFAPLPDYLNFWEEERVVAVSRFTGTQMSVDTGYGVAIAASTGSFNFNKIILGGVNDSSHNTQSSSKVAELAVWTTDIGVTSGRQVQSNASGAYAALNTQWNGKKVMWVGTSMPVTVTDDGNRNPYPMRLASAIGAWIINQGSGSSRITYDPTWYLGLSATIAEQAANGFSAYSRESYENKILAGVGDLDYLVIDHCLNDFGKTMGLVSSTDKQEYCGALNFIRNQTLAAYPACQIICLTPITNLAFGGGYVAGINTAAQALRDWAAQYDNVRLMDPLADLAWGSSEATAYLGDGTHLNAAGAAEVANYLIDQFNGEYPPPP